jgi:hypothetical protein
MKREEDSFRGKNGRNVAHITIEKDCTKDSK